MGLQANWAILAGLNAQALVSTADAEIVSGAAIDLQPYAVGHREIKAVLNVGSVATQGVLKVQWQEADTSLVTSFTAITAGTFTNYTTGSAVGMQTPVHFQTNKRYIRAYAEVETGSYVFSTHVMVPNRIV